MAHTRFDEIFIFINKYERKFYLICTHFLSVRKKRRKKKQPISFNYSQSLFVLKNLKY